MHYGICAQQRLSSKQVGHNIRYPSWTLSYTKRTLPRLSDCMDTRNDCVWIVVAFQIDQPQDEKIYLDMCTQRKLRSDSLHNRTWWSDSSLVDRSLHSHGAKYSFGIWWRMILIQSNLDSSNTDGSFNMANSNSFFEFLRNSSDSSRKQIFREIFLFYYEIVCCVYSLESPHRGDSNEYTQHTIIVWKIEKISLSYRYLLPDLVVWLNLIGSNYPSLEQISMVPKMFEPLKFDCMSVGAFS